MDGVRRLTRMQRETAAARAAEIDLSPLVRAGGVLLVVLMLSVLVAIVVPDTGAFGGPLQDRRVASTSSLARAHGKDDVLTNFAFFVPWNASVGTVVLDELLPLEAEGVEVARAGVLPLGTDPLDPGRGFPPDGQRVSRIAGLSIGPGSSPLDAVQIVVGLRGNGSVLGWLLRYHAGSTSYATILTQGVQVCSRGCEAREEVAARQRAWAASLSPFVVGPPR